MSILEGIDQQLQEMIDAGIDLTSSSQQLVIPSKTQEPVQFSTVYGDGGIAGITTTDIILTEANVRQQIKKNTVDEKMTVLVLAFACPQAKVWAQVDGEMVLHPIYSKAEFGQLVGQMPYIYTQLNKSNPEAVEQFRQLLEDNEYLVRQQIGEGLANSKTADIEGVRWALEAPNPQSGNFANDTRAKQASGLKMASITLAAPRQLDTEREQFTDIFDSWTKNLMRVVKEVQLVDEEPGSQAERDGLRQARRLAGSLTGATHDAEQGGDTLYSLRASCGELVVEGQPVLGGHAPNTAFNFWPNQVATG